MHLPPHIALITRATRAAEPCAKDQITNMNVLLVVQGQVFFARFYAGDDPFPDGKLPPGSDEERLQVLLDSLADVPVIMRTMAPALRKIVAASCP